MVEQSAVPMIVLTRSQDHVEAINSTLRNAGHAVHCSWIRDLHDLGDALTQIDAEMLIAFLTGGEPASEITTVMRVRDQSSPTVPVLFAADKIDEDLIALAMQHGAQDVISLGSRGRLESVVTRELKAFRLERSLNSAVNSAQEYRQQLQSFMSGSADAIAHVQEGIAVDVNPAWLELFGYTEADSMAGQPLMDTFDADAQAALKGALVACLQGKWSDHSLRVNGVLSDGSTVPLELELLRTEYEGEPAVRVSVAARRRDAAALDQQLTQAIEQDAATGLLQRRYFLDHLARALAEPIKGGVRELLYIEPDRYTTILDDLGPLMVDEFAGQFAAVLKEQLQPSDLAGRFSDGGVVILLERGTRRDVEVWAGNLVRKVQQHLFRVNDKSLTCTCSVGVGLIGARNSTDATASLQDALQARKRAFDAGGNRVFVLDKTEDDTKQQAADKLWVKLIKSALMENRFRLVQQPIASLLGEEKGMFDVLVRMLDEHGQEVLPSEFIAAAERNDLLKNIDRWVVGAAMSLCANRPVTRMFVRLSKDSLVDRSLPQWLSNQLKATRVDPERIAFQVSESIAAQHLAETVELAAALRKAGFRFAIEHFGVGRNPAQLLEQLPLDYLKIDGSLMQGLASDQGQQQRVKELVDAARTKRVATIAERVEDANTMAVLWQLGIEFLQGYFVNEPEQVVLG